MACFLGIICLTTERWKLQRKNCKACFIKFKVEMFYPVTNLVHRVYNRIVIFSISMNINCSTHHGCGSSMLMFPYLHAVSCSVFFFFVMLHCVREQCLIVDEYKAQHFLLCCTALLCVTSLLSRPVRRCVLVSALHAVSSMLLLCRAWWSCLHNLDAVNNHVSVAVPLK